MPAPSLSHTTGAAAARRESAIHLPCVHDLHIPLPDCDLMKSLQYMGSAALSYDEDLPQRMSGPEPAAGGNISSRLQRYCEQIHETQPALCSAGQITSGETLSSSDFLSLMGITTLADIDVALQSKTGDSQCIHVCSDIWDRHSGSVGDKIFEAHREEVSTGSGGLLTLCASV